MKQQIIATWAWVFATLVVRLAESFLRFFSLEDVPAIRGPLPADFSDVHFRSDLSALLPLSIRTLIDRDPIFWDLLPSEDVHV